MWPSSTSSTSSTISSGCGALRRFLRRFIMASPGASLVATRFLVR
eukprot:CAMPEP_0182947010 /NCGR_PEP_ID=MMETSP0105_2-20130417/57886_1 /TAXON_ID=81532 ORGANISM="Acanthoeca-like sp., Strain 10tr" /NCGR_SAMPLE_ID=MMETSP0105_2 /ASSEMBLY_ACC=CAM_ASM_000205 /LENGTH=44 /DNA_ID= /DNA_START= /DNA_END= /DNA_ORIENTATION=